MAALEISTERVKIPNGDLEIPAYLAAPTGDGSYPAIVVLQEIFGVNSHIREVTARIATSGYIALAPAIFQRALDDILREHIGKICYIYIDDIIIFSKKRGGTLQTSGNYI